VHVLIVENAAELRASQTNIETVILYRHTIASSAAIVYSGGKRRVEYIYIYYMHIMSAYKLSESSPREGMYARDRCRNV